MGLFKRDAARRVQEDADRERSWDGPVVPASERPLPGAGAHGSGSGTSSAGAEDGEERIPRWAAAATVAFVAVPVVGYILSSWFNTGYAGVVGQLLGNLLLAIFFLALFAVIVAVMVFFGFSKLSVPVSIFAVVSGLPICAVLGFQIWQGASVALAAAQDLAVAPVALTATYDRYEPGIDDDPGTASVRFSNGDTAYWSDSSGAYGMLSAAHIEVGDSFVAMVYPRSHVLESVRAAD